MKKITLLWCFILLSCLFCVSCGGGGGGGTTAGAQPGEPAIDPPIDPGQIYAQSEGSLEAPVQIAANGTHNGFSGFSPSYYQFSTNSVGSYIIKVMGATDEITWNLYSGSDFSGTVKYCNNNYGAADEICTVVLDGTTDYFLRVTDWDQSFTNVINFQIEIVEINGEGSPSGPVNLTVGQTHGGMVDYLSSSYYMFTPSADKTHVISIDNINPSYYGNGIIVDVMDDSGYTNIIESCTNVPALCVLNSLTAGTTYYLKVKESGQSQYSYDIAVNEGLSEGAVGAPMVLQLGQAHSGGVDANGDSYYAFTASSSGTYQITVNSPRYFYLYSDPFFSNQITSVYSATGTCLLPSLDAGTEYYFRTDGGVSSETYQLIVSSAQSEGSINDPVSLTLEDTRTANIDAYGENYYSFVPLSDGEHHVVLSGPYTGMYWDIYDAQRNWLSSCGNYSDPTYTQFSCVTPNLTAGNQYLLDVSTQSSVAHSFDIRTSAFGYGEGSIAQPVVLNAGINHSGGVNGTDTFALGESFYTFQTTDPGEYEIVFQSEVSAPSFYAAIYASADFDEASRVATCTLQSDQRVCNPQALGRNQDYYLRVWNSGHYDYAYDIALTGPILPAGCSGAGTCFDFEDGLFPATFTSGGTGGDPWWPDASNDATGTGLYSLSAGVTANSRSTCFSYAAPSATSVHFSVRSDSQEGLDALVFYIDGLAEPTTWSGDTGWHRAAYGGLSAGTHTFKWCYEKSKFDAFGQDTAWVDDIEVW